MPKMLPFFKIYHFHEKIKPVSRQKYIITKISI